MHTKIPSFFSINYCNQNFGNIHLHDFLVLSNNFLLPILPNTSANLNLFYRLSSPTFRGGSRKFFHILNRNENLQRTANQFREYSHHLNLRLLSEKLCVKEVPFRLYIFYKTKKVELACQIKVTLQYLNQSNFLSLAT